jgi:hypothetical protein
MKRPKSFDDLRHVQLLGSRQENLKLPIGRWERMQQKSLEQGDQNGRIFAFGVTVFFGQCFLIKEIAQI